MPCFGLLALEQFLGYEHSYHRSGFHLYLTEQRNALPASFSTKYTDNESGLLYYGYRYYNSEAGRWSSRDPIEEGDGINMYAFTQNDETNRWDLLGMAYFSYRPLGGVLGLFGVQGKKIDDKLNTVIGHEQLFFEDGKNPSNIGLFDDGTLKSESGTRSYRGPHDSGWNDCVMREAVKRAPLHAYCLLGKPGATEKFNCRIGLMLLRREYRKLVKKPEVLGACCPTKKEKQK